MLSIITKKVVRRAFPYFYSLRYLAASAKDEVDPTKYYENRKASLKQTVKYPYNYCPSTSVKAFLEAHRSLAQEDNDKQTKEESLAGRITSIRRHGRHTFLDVREQHVKLQAVVDQLDPTIKRGDIVSLKGVPFRTLKGELSIRASEVRLLAPCLHMLPEYQHLKEVETRYRKRYLDMMVNQETMNKLKIRSRIIQFLRGYLTSKGFYEVETPSLSTSAGGAIAKPFETYLHELDMKLFLRIAPELYLKQLLIGGMERVFEIGKNFRNEGMDQTHNPEFTSCELYATYQNYENMIKFTEELLAELVKEVTGSYEMKTTQDGKERLVNFKGPYRRIPLVGGLEEALKLSLPTEFDSEESRRFLDDLCVKHRVQCGEPRSTSRLLDKLAGEFLEGAASPLFITDHPRVMSPLAKPHQLNPHLTERFELFVNGWEIVNSYTELNDPEEQLRNSPTDVEFAHSLEYGLPPCAGWGIGLDRLAMLLTNSSNIQEVIAFPLMKPL